MALRGKQPEPTDKRLKAMFFGVAGVGKTTAAIQFPRPYLIDTERGAENDQYVAIIKKAGGAVFQTSDFDEMIAEVTALLGTKHDYRTVIIDPLTVVYADLLAKAAEELRRISVAKGEANATGTEFGRHYAVADRRMKHLLNLLLRLDMNVIVTCHAKTVYGDDMKKLGDTFDGYKKLDYLFDLVFEIQKRGQNRVGLVRKTRVSAFPEGDIFPFNYDEVAQRYGRDILERDAKPQVLASAEQVAELKRLVEVLRVSEDTTEAWLEKCGAETFAEMPAEVAAKCIDWCMKKVSKGEAA